MVRNVVVWNSWKKTLLAALILGFNIFDGLNADGNIGKLLNIKSFAQTKSSSFLYQLQITFG